jgi:hypothetical protein
LGCLDGLVLHGIPHTSKQVVFGFIPDPDHVYSSSSRAIDCLEVETSKIPSDSKIKHKTGKRMMHIHFTKATATYNRDKQPRRQMIRNTHYWKAPAGWVTRIEYQRKGGSLESTNNIQEGGDRTVSFVEKGETKTFTIGDPEDDATKTRWGQGNFTPGELSYLSAVGIKVPNNVISEFLIGAAKDCGTDYETSLSPDCAVYRYLMNLKELKDCKSKSECAQAKPGAPAAPAGPGGPLGAPPRAGGPPPPSTGAGGGGGSAGGRALAGACAAGQGGGGCGARQRAAPCGA